MFLHVNHPSLDLHATYHTTHYQHQMQQQKPAHHIRGQEQEQCILMSVHPPDSTFCYVFLSVVRTPVSRGDSILAGKMVHPQIHS